MPNQNVAETLRAMARDWDVETSPFCQERHAACESGARCVEIVARLAAMEPWIPLGSEARYDGCAFCDGARRCQDDVDMGRHDADCLWQQARAVITEQEGS